MLLTNLADVCRKTGLKVVEIPGWRTRGHGEFTDLQAIINHHTATPNSIKGDYPTLATVRDGRPGLDGPLSQLGLGRSGTIYVISAGVAWHAGATFYSWQNNWHALGIEAEHPGGSTPWPSVQYGAYVLLNRVLADSYGISYRDILGHKEIAYPLGRKSDPNFSMPGMRSAVYNIGEVRDMEFTDALPGNVKDPDGSPVTVGEALARGNWAYFAAIDKLDEFNKANGK